MSVLVNEVQLAYFLCHDKSLYNSVIFTFIAMTLTKEEWPGSLVIIVMSDGAGVAMMW